MADPDESAWRQWRHALVRDLAWVLASPPLLAPQPGAARWVDAAWGRAAFAASRDWLATLDRDPAPLQQALALRPGRLGSYFEGLLDAWLAWPGNPLYRRLYHGLPVRVGKRTVGELDFLVEERASGEIQHWEVAVKFYLGIAPGGHAADWVGPGLRDRLDLKLDRLRGHQLPLADTPDAAGLLQALQLPLPQPVCLVRGRFFYPPAAFASAGGTGLPPGPGDAPPSPATAPAGDAAVPLSGWAPASAAAGHQRGWWMDAATFLSRFTDPGIAWMRLPREHWLAPVDISPGSDGVRIGEPMSAATLVEAWRSAADNRAVAVVGLAEGREVTRGFITPDPWPRNPDPE